MKNNKRNFILIFALTIIVLYLALKDNFAEKIKYLISFDIKWLIVAFILILSYWFLKGLVLYYCTKKVYKDYKEKQGILLMITTQFFHAITPFSAGGQPWQIYKLKKDGLSLGQSSNVIIQDFIAYQIALVLLGAIAIISNYTFHLFPANNILKKLVILGFTINTLVVAFLFLVAFSQKWNKKLIDGTINILHKFKIIKNKEEKLKHSEQFIQNFHQSAIVLFKDKRNVLRIVFLNLIALIGQYLIPFALLMGLGIYLNPLKVIVTSAYVMLIGSMMPIPGGTGGLEYSFLAFYQNFITEPMLSSIMIAWRIITYYFGILIGGITLSFNKEAK